MQCMLGNISSCVESTLHFSCSSQKILNLDIEISKKNFHPSIQHNGGRKMGVKNPKIFTPKVVLDPNSIFKIHHFVVISLFQVFGTSFADLQFNVFTHFKMSDEIFFNTSKTPIKRAFFWNQKIQKIMTPKGFCTQNRG